MPFQPWNGKETDPSHTEDIIDWRLTTWEGSRCEQLRRWGQLPLERAIMAMEEMEALFMELHQGHPPNEESIVT